MQLAGRYTQQMNLEEAAVLPGAYDAWVDLEALGRWIDAELDVRLASTVEEAQAMVRNAGGDAGGADDWLLGWGWDENDWPDGDLPDRAALDAVGVDRPVALLHRSGRAAWLNGAALLALAGELDALDGVPRDASGQPTGILIGEAVGALDGVLAAGDRQRQAWLAEGARRAAASGITRAATAPVDTATLEALLELEFRGLLPLRVDARLAAEAVAGYTGSRLAARVGDSALVRVVAVGARLDGPIASHLAALSEPYADGTPAPPFDAEALRAGAAAARTAFLPLHVQASGDAAVAAALEEIAALQPVEGVVVGLDLLPAELQGDLSRVRVAIAPARFARDVYGLDRVLGPERAARAHPWADLAARGLTLRLASDAPAYPLRPLAAVATAMSRQDAEGYPAGGWHPVQGLPRERLLRALVGEAAGMAPGAPADLVVWSEDPLAGDEPLLRRAEALLTIVAGRVAYSRALVQLPMSGERRP
jgi:hypothetical protein